ncbi:MAG: hypothetical protein CME88_05740 [Hirschia sp.]|nr:hypothetical protein [Hirschia sp.]MBF17866.1 hypothetical protein [Hirschia sp.]
MASNVNQIEKLDMDELLSLKEEVDTRIQQLAKSELDTLQQKMDRLKSLAGDRKTGQRKDAGTKAPAKFADPVSGKTWSGRGMTPVWLREYEAEGKSREDYAIK